MNETIVKNIINVLKTSSDKSVIYKALVKLRTDLVTGRPGIELFRMCNGIQPVVRLLNRPHEKILEVALSILANCCTELESCTEAIENKIISPLVTILKCIPNPTVQCRACRLLGNLAREALSSMRIQGLAIGQSLFLILEENNDIGTLMMAARAVRLCCVEREFLKNFAKCELFKILIKLLVNTTKNGEQSSIIECDEKMQTVGRKSNQPRERYFEEVARNLEGVRSDIFDHEFFKKEKRKRNTEYILPKSKDKIDLVLEILRSIQAFSEVQNFVPVVELYHAGEGFSCLVSLVEENNKFRSLGLKILSNFSRNQQAIAALSDADAVSIACELFTATDLENSLTEPEVKYCLNIICLLAVDACNRAKIRRSGALLNLIERAKLSTSCSEVSLILFALNNFQYDNLSMDLLLRAGLVGVLIKELDAYLNCDDGYRKAKCEEKKKISKKRKFEQVTHNLSSKSSRTWNALFEPEPSTSCSFQTSSVISSPITSPSPSPCSSRSMSPISMTSKYFDENVDLDSEIYSPVCSEDEEESSIAAGGKNVLYEDNDVMKLLEECYKTENNVEETLLDKNDDDDDLNKASAPKVPATGSLPTSTIDIIDNLLMRISLQLKNRGELVKPETLKTIIQAICTFGTQGNFFSNALTNIVSESVFLVPILKQDVIYRIYQMTKIEELKFCGENVLECIGSVSESGYGRGELTRLLVKSEEYFQKRAAIAVAFAIRSPKILYPLLIENGALYTLVNTILNRNESLRTEAAEGLTSLSHTVGIKLPQYDLSQFDLSREFEEAIDFPDCGNDSDDTMRFIIHRGCSKIPIKFNQKLLTENSEVFRSMLTSDFREYNEREVHLKETSVNGIKYFLHLIDFEANNEKKPYIPPIYHFDSILEAYELSRMYILENFEKKLFSLITHRISAATCLRTFEWALKHMNPELTDIAINYYLCSNLSGEEKVELFTKADYSVYSKEWNQMIIDAILCKLENCNGD